MAAFRALLRIDQSLDGKTVIINDISAYGNNTEDIVLADMDSRIVAIYNSAGNVVTQVTFDPAALTVNYAITKDLYLSFGAFFQADDVMYQSTLHWYSKRFYDIQAVASALKSVCGCAKNTNLCTNASKALICMEQALPLFLSGDAVNCQLLLDAANSFISQTTKCPC